MRLRLAGEMVGGDAKGVMAQMRGALDQGRAVDIAGYTLSPGVARGLEHAMLVPPDAAIPGQRLEWFEVSMRESTDAPMNPALARALAPWQQSGYHCKHHALHGPAFWQSGEIEELPALISATTAALCT